MCPACEEGLSDIRIFVFIAIEPLAAYVLVHLSTSLSVFKWPVKQDSYGSGVFGHTVVTINWGQGKEPGAWATV